MVVDEVEDVDAGGVVVEVPVGDVCLPALVGQLGFETPAGGTGAFAGLGSDQAMSMQDPADRRRGRGIEAVVVQVPGDRGWSCISTLAGEGLALKRPGFCSESQQGESEYAQEVQSRAA